MNELERYTDDELRQELKRRDGVRKAAMAAVPRCRNCKHYATVDVWGRPNTFSYINRYSGACPFLLSKRGTTKYKITNACNKACEHYEPKEQTT